MKLLDIISETTTPASVVAGPGETVYSLGRKYAVDPQTLFKLNNFNKDTKLELGQKVILSANPQQEKPSKSGIPSAVPLKNKQPKANVQLEPQGLGATIEQAAKSNGIAGVHLANFMAQCKVETAGFKSLHEWASGDQYEGRLDLGNIYPGDGRKFKGRGFIHLTGRGDYTKCNKKYDWQNTAKDIVKNPTLVETNIDIAITTSLWYWDTYIRHNYKAESIVAVSTRVNGTNPNGLGARIDAFKNYCAKLGIKIKGIMVPIHKATKHHAELAPGMDPNGTQVAANDDADAIQTDLAEDQTEQFCPNCGGSLAEEGRASRALCTSGRPDSALGASQLASCKSQGLRARDGDKSHLITHGARKVRVTVGGKKIKGKKYGGPLPDYGTRKAQLSEDTGTVVYAIGDSHAEGLAYTSGIKNYAQGAQPSTSTTNLSGSYNGHPIGLSNVPKGAPIVIAQGCNDSANSLRANLDSKGKTPLVSPATIAGNVAKLVSAAEAAGHKVVFVLFPNGDAKIKPYYGGDYTEKVRQAIKSAVGVPIIDLEGSTLSDGVHAVPSAYKSAGAEVLALFGNSNKTKSSNEKPPTAPVTKPTAGNAAGNEGDLKTSGSIKTTSDGTPAGTKTNIVIPAKELTVPWDSRDTEPVTDIQNALVALGYNLQVTGKIDKATRLSLISYQAHNRLDVTGTANVETVNHLNRFQRIMAKVPTAGDTKTSTASSTSPSKPVAPPAQSSSKWGADIDSTTQNPKKEVPPKEKPVTSGSSYKPTSNQISDQIKFAENRKIISNNMGTPEGKAMITKYFLKKNVSFNHVTGILLNMAFESGFDSGSYVAHDSAKAKGSPEYLRAGPSGGLCHWHDAFEKDTDGVRRFSNMVKACGGEDAWQMNWEKQLDFLLSEKETVGYLAQKFTSAEQAAEWFTKHWEFPQNPDAEATKRSSDPRGILYKPGKKE